MARWFGGELAVLRRKRDFGSGGCLAGVMSSAQSAVLSIVATPVAESVQANNKFFGAGRVASDTVRSLPPGEVAEQRFVLDQLLGHRIAVSIGQANPLDAVWLGQQDAGLRALEERHRIAGM